MKRTITRQTTLLLAFLAATTMTGCVETVRLSRGTRIPPEHRGVSSAEVTEAFTKHIRGEHLSMAATFVDFSYVRAITQERGRSRDQEREAYHRYVRRQTTFYVNLVLHGLDSCRPQGPRRGPDADEDDDDDDAIRDALRLEAWTFRLRTSSGRERSPEGIEPGATQLAPSGGCLVQGYVHFPGNVSRRDEWIELQASTGERGRYSSEVRWTLEHYEPQGRPRRPPGERPRPRPAPDQDDGQPDSDRSEPERAEPERAEPERAEPEGGSTESEGGSTESEGDNTFGSD